MVTYIKNWFSNMTPSPIKVDGIEYKSVENFYQAAKTLALPERHRIAILNPSASKKAGRTVKLRDDWESVKLAIMYIGLRHKFDQPQWNAQLQATGCEYLVEWNNWGDCVWGTPCKVAPNGFAIPTGQTGHNYLGRLLMFIRDSKPINIANISLDNTDELVRLSSVLCDTMPSVPNGIVDSATSYETSTMPSERVSVAVYGSEIESITHDVATRLVNIITIGGQIHLLHDSSLGIAVKRWLDARCYSRLTWHDSVATLVNSKYGLLVKNIEDNCEYEYHHPSRTRIVNV